MKALVITLFAVFVFIYGTVMAGLLIHFYNIWFIPIIFEAPFSLTFVQCIAVALIISLFKNSNSSNIKSEFKDNLGSIVGFFLDVPFKLLLGYILYSFLI